MSLNLQLLAMLRRLRKNIVVDTSEGIRGVKLITMAGCIGKGYLFTLDDPDTDEGGDNGKENGHKKNNRGGRQCSGE